MTYIIKPDLLQCQGYIDDGSTIMTMGGVIRNRARCENAPAYIVCNRGELDDESDDSLADHLSMCPSCLKNLKQVLGPTKFALVDVTEIVDE